MRKFLFYSSFLVITLLVVTQKVLSSPNKLGAKEINYGFVTTSEALAKTSSRTGKAKYKTGYCVEFLNNLKEDYNFRSKYSFHRHPIANQGAYVKGIFLNSFDGLENGKLDIHCGAMTPKNDSKDYEKSKIILSIPFFESEVKVLIVEDLSNEFLQIESLSDLGNIFKNKKYTVGILEGQEAIKETLLINGFDSNNIKIYSDQDELQAKLENRTIKGIANDTLHMKSYIDSTTFSSLNIREKYFILPPPRPSVDVRTGELVTYRFAFRSTDGDIKDDLIDSSLEKSSYVSLRKGLEVFRTDINNFSRKKQKALPTSEPFWDNVLNHLRLRFQSKFYINFFIIGISLAFLLFAFPHETRPKIIDIIKEVLSKILKDRINLLTK